MTEIANVVLEGIKQLFEDNYIDLVLYLSILLLSVWLYKEFRKRLLDTENQRNDQVIKLLRVLTDLEFELHEFKRSRSNFNVLKEKLIQATPFISYELNRMISSIKPNMDDAAINDFFVKLRDEIDGYKYAQSDSISHINEKSVIRIIEYHYKSKFEPIFYPLIMTLITIVIILLILLITISISIIDSSSEKFYFIFYNVNLIIFLSFLLGIIDIILNKRFLNKWSTWLGIIMMFVLSVASLILAQLNSIWSIVLFLLFILGTITLLPKILKRDRSM